MKKLIRETAEEILQEYTNCYSEADEDCLAKMLENLASNMAREIFAEIETVLYSVAHPIVRADGTVDVKRMDGFHIREEDYNAIKKKYESEGVDDV